MKAVRRELAAVRNDIRAIEKGKAPSRRVTPPSRSRVAPAVPVDYTAPDAARALRGEDSDPVESLLETEKRQPHRKLDEERLAQEDQAIKQRAKNMRDERFTDYLASSFEAGSDLRYERKVQRNKAILLAVVVLVVLIWVVRRLFG